MSRLLQADKSIYRRACKIRYLVQSLQLKSYYITGFFILLGVILGRFICGFLCPFGWFQDLLHKIPGKKLSTAKLKPLRYLKYVILIVFVILLPMLVTNSIGMGDPFFCKYICPQGVLEGAIPLSIGNAAIRSAICSSIFRMVSISSLSVLSSSSVNEFLFDSTVPAR
jgi:ferredoxin-type protein NapH